MDSKPALPPVVTYKQVFLLIGVLLVLLLLGAASFFLVWHRPRQQHTQLVLQQAHQLIAQATKQTKNFPVELDKGDYDFWCVASRAGITSRRFHDKNQAGKSPSGMLRENPPYYFWQLLRKKA